MEHPIALIRFRYICSLGFGCFRPQDAFLTLCQRINFSLALACLAHPPPRLPPQFPSRFASSPVANVSQTPTFAGRRYNNVPLNTCQPPLCASRGTPCPGPRRRIRSSCVSERNLTMSVRPLLPIRPSLVARSVHVYNNPRPASARGGARRHPIAGHSFPPSFPFASSPPLASSVTPVMNPRPSCWSLTGPSRSALPRPSQSRSSGSRGAISLSPLVAHTPVSGSKDSNSQPPPPVHSCARSRLRSTARFYILFPLSNSHEGHLSSI